MQISRIARPSALFLALLLAAPSARAARPLTNVTLEKGSYASVFDSNGTSGSLDGGELPYIFDGDPETSGKVRAGGLGAGSSIVVDFPLELLGDANHLVYADTVALNMVGNAKYSLYFSENGTDWEPVSGVERMSASSNAVHNVKERVKSIKLVFDTLSGTVELFEFQVWGWVSTKPQVVSKYAIASFHNPDGSIALDNNGNLNEFTGGDNWAGGKALFDGNFTRQWPWPRAPKNGFVMVDFTKNDGTTALQEYYVTEIRVGSTGDLKYTLQYSDDGTVWHDVEGAAPVAYPGTATFAVGVLAKQVRYVFTEVNGGYSQANAFLAEIEVWGMDPDDAPCTHPAWTAWSPVENSAACLDFGMDERFCTTCGERQTRTNFDLPPIGHDYITTLDRPGKYRKFGSGYITCSRCDLFLPCTNVYEQASTNGPVDLIKWGGMAVDNVIQFTDFSVTSSDHPQWGPNPKNVIDGNWNWGWCTYWVSAGWNDQHVDFKFGTTIDLTKIEISVHNHPDCLLQFYDVDDATGEETLLTECLAEFLADETHLEGVEEIVFTPVVFAETEDGTPSADKTYYVVATNGTAALYVPTNGLAEFKEGTSYFEASATGAVFCKRDGSEWKQTSVADGFETNATYAVQSATADKYYTLESSGKYVSAGAKTSFTAGTTYYRLTGATSGENLGEIVDSRPDCTRQTVRFYQTPCTHLRLRMQEEQGYSLWSGHSMCIVEMRPWGTVRGAGDTPYRKETLMILR